MKLETIRKVKGLQMMADHGIVKMREELTAAAQDNPDAQPLLDAAEAAHRAMEEIHDRLTQLAIEAAANR